VEIVDGWAYQTTSREYQVYGHPFGGPRTVDLRPSVFFPFAAFGFHASFPFLISHTRLRLSVRRRSPLLPTLADRWSPIHLPKNILKHKKMLNKLFHKCFKQNLKIETERRFVKNLKKLFWAKSWPKMFLNQT
jgi:hypothetical protein